jgi:hypothetical protein
MCDGYLAKLAVSENQLENQTSLFTTRLMTCNVKIHHNNDAPFVDKCKYNGNEYKLLYDPSGHCLMASEFYPGQLIFMSNLP